MIRILSDPGALALAAAETIAKNVRHAIGREGRCTLALSGGETPLETYRMLARRHRDSVPWDRVHFFWGDERFVPPDHEESNYGAVQRELLKHLPIREESQYRVRTELESPEAAADDYQDRIQEFFGVAEDARPRFDLVLLGLGEDGHTASLLPGCEARWESSRQVVSCTLETRAHPRITLTLPVLNAAKRTLFLVSGSRKARILRRTLEGSPADVSLPARRVRPFGEPPMWLVDQDAAQELSAELLSRASGGSAGLVDRDAAGELSPELLSRANAGSAGLGDGESGTSHDLPTKDD
jgi:6-phosphogluconolactonase